MRGARQSWPSSVSGYCVIREAGYNVLYCDMRTFGHSGAANGGIGSNGLFESR
jgi:uncharacterized protein